jgi:hypothetical protein
LVSLRWLGRGGCANANRTEGPRLSKRVDIPRAHANFTEDLIGVLAQ